MFLQGTDLNNAFGSHDMHSMLEHYVPENTRGIENAPKMNHQQAVANVQVNSQPTQVAPGMQQSRSTPISQLPQHNGNVLQNGNMYDSSEFHKAMQHEQQVQQMVHLQKQKQKQMMSKEAFKGNSEDESYLDKLWSKKRDITKLFIFACIILLAFSLHALAEFYIKHLFQTSVFSFKQQIMVKALYPLTILVLLWNIKAFML